MPVGLAYNRGVPKGHGAALAAREGGQMASVVDRSAPTSGLTESEKQIRQAVLDYVKYFNAHSVQGMISCFDEEGKWLDIPIGTPYRGHARIREMLTAMFDAFPDVSYELQDLVVRGDHAAARFLMRSTHLGTLYGVPATGRAVVLPSLGFITFRDGKIISDHCYFDLAMVLRQWGLMPPLSAAFSGPGQVVMWLAVKGRTPLAIGSAAVAGALIIGSLLRRRRR